MPARTCYQSAPRVPLHCQLLINGAHPAVGGGRSHDVSDAQRAGLYQQCRHWAALTIQVRLDHRAPRHAVRIRDQLLDLQGVSLSELSTPTIASPQTYVAT